jgi:hypothetical protein
MLGRCAEFALLLIGREACFAVMGYWIAQIAV